jgi:hypothetical protein
MSTDAREERLERRISDLSGTDQQFADTRPSDSVRHAIASLGRAARKVRVNASEGPLQFPVSSKNSAHLDIAVI